MHRALINRLVALAIAGLILGAGLCLLHADQGAPGSVCVSLLAIATGLLLAIFFTPATPVVAATRPAHHLDPRDLAAPPPRA